MIADRQFALVVERVTVRCDECPRQASVYISSPGIGTSLDEQLASVGWDSYAADSGHVHYCHEHTS